MSNQPNVFHYTTRLNLSKILKERTISLTPGFTEMEKPGVWLSTNPDFENFTVSISKTDNILRLRKEREINALGMARIEIDLSKVRVFTINQFKNISKISTRNFKNLSYFANQCNSNMNEWRICFSPIKSSAWKKIELFDQNNSIWKELDFIKADLKKLLVESKQYINFMDNFQKKELNSILDLLNLKTIN
ncbi:MAG: hypothetical protein RBR53_06930 [Desulforegulaceae bacterium]|nr:hypothetical protein [Desulforegulaceae bacterium]